MAGRIVVTGRVPEPALDVLREAGALDAHAQETALLGRRSCTPRSRAPTRS